MTLWQRIESLDELDAYLRDLFGPDIQPSGTNGYQVMFTVAGKAKPVMSALQEKPARTAGAASPDSGSTAMTPST